MLKIMRFFTLVLASLGMTLGAAHTLELIPKMSYSPELYAQVTSTLYRYYGTVGGPIQVSAVLASAIVSFLARGSRGFSLSLAGTICFIISLGLWVALVQPVNVEWSKVLQTGPHAAVVESYVRLRPRWEYGHVAAFIAWFAGVAFLILSITAHTEDNRQKEH